MREGLLHVGFGPLLYSVADKRQRDRQVFPVEFGGFDWR